LIQGCAEEQKLKGCGEDSRLTALPVAYFFSVPMMAPLRAAAFNAAAPRTTVSRWAPPPPRVLLPILVTDSQSSDMFASCVWCVVGNYEGDCLVKESFTE